MRRSQVRCRTNRKATQAHRADVRRLVSLDRNKPGFSEKPGSLRLRLKHRPTALSSHLGPGLRLAGRIVIPGEHFAKRLAVGHLHQRGRERFELLQR